MGEGLGVTFLDLWWAEFHAGKEVRAKLVGLPGSAVGSICCVDFLRKHRWTIKNFVCNLLPFFLGTSFDN